MTFNDWGLMGVTVVAPIFRTSEKSGMHPCMPDSGEFLSPTEGACRAQEGRDRAREMKVSQLGELVREVNGPALILCGKLLRMLMVPDSPSSSQFSGS